MLSLIRRVLEYIATIHPGHERSEYARGFGDALDNVEEFIRDGLWERGEDVDV